MWMYLRKNKQKFREIDFYLILWICWAWIFLNFLAHCGYLFSFSKSLHIPNVYSHTLFYFCLQFEFYSLSFLTFFALKNITHSYQAIQSSNFLWKIFRALQECAALSNGFNAQLRGFFFVIHTRYWIDITIQKYEVYFMLDEMLQQNASKFVIFYVLTYIQNEKKIWVFLCTNYYKF